MAEFRPAQDAHTEASHAAKMLKLQKQQKSHINTLKRLQISRMFCIFAEC